MLENSPRIGRVSDVLHHELAKLIQDECADPRLGLVTISGIDLSSDLKNAKVFVTVLQNDQIEQSLAALNNAAGFLRSKLAKQVTFRTVPKLQFIYDQSILQGNRMDDLFASLNCNNDDKDDE